MMGGSLDMDMVKRWLSWSLRAGSLYFFLVSVAHAAGFKVPGLFIYFDVPSYAYQDRIIAFLSLGWSILFWIVALDPDRDRRMLAGILVMGSAGTFGLVYINLTTNFSSIQAGLRPGAYWIATALLAGYLLLLIFLTLRLNRGT
jgi:hypothetical protein